MKKKLLTIIGLIIFLSCVLFISKTYAVTDKQLEVGQAIADFAVDVCNNNKSDFGYSFYFGKNGEVMESSMANRRDANRSGIKYSGYVYLTRNNGSGDYGWIENKFAVYCASFAHLMVYHAIGGVEPSYENVSPSIDNLLPGDVVSVRQELTSGGYNGHTFVFVGYSDPNNHYKMIVAQSPGQEGSSKAAIGTFEEDFGKTVSASETKSWSVTAIERISAAQAENISYNYLNASKDLYDRIDHDNPEITNVTHNNKGQITIKATDVKTLKYPTKRYNNVGVQGSLEAGTVSEPANNGIIAYQVTQSSTEPTTGWISVDKTESLNITTEPVKSNGMYYAWVLDVGGNTAYAQVGVDGISFDNTPPTLGTPKVTTTENSITLEISGATDSSGIKQYAYYLDNNLIATQSENKYTYSNLTDATNYTLKYEVTDNNENTATSQNISATTATIKITEAYTISSGFISRIKPETSRQAFINNINPKVSYTILTKDGEAVGDTESIGTGMKLVTQKYGTYTIIVTGDITGNGKILSTDIIKLKRNLVQLETFDEVTTKAADIDNSGGIGLTDLIKQKQAFVGLIEL